MLMSEHDGQGMVEYGLILALIAIAVLGALGAFGGGLGGSLADSASRISEAIR